MVVAGSSFVVGLWRHRREKDDHFGIASANPRRTLVKRCLCLNNHQQDALQLIRKRTTIPSAVTKEHHSASPL